MIEPIRLSFELPCSAAHAFDTWTKRVSTWWPPSHKTSGDPEALVTFEPRVGGRIFERTSDGREVDWGEILEWSPPNRLRYSWHIATDRANATEVTIEFTDLADHQTRVEITHDGWDRLGDRGPSWRDRNTGGWSGLLPVYRRACAPNA